MASSPATVRLSRYGCELPTGEVNLTTYNSPMICPRCVTHTLKAVDTTAGPTLDFCGTCGGVWFDEGELKAFLNWKISPEWLPRDVDLTQCPRCETNTLGGFVFGKDGPLLDGCSTCSGVWFDKGEVTALKKLSPNARTTKVKDTVVPLLSTEGQTGTPIDWKWVLIGFFLMMTMLGASSIVINLWIVSDAVMDAESRTSPDVLMAVGGGISFAVSGFLVGWRSSAYTLWEPAIVAVPAALMFPFVFTTSVTTRELLVASVAAFLVTMFAAVIGERF